MSAQPEGTGSKTMADLAGLAAAKHGDKPALRHKSGVTQDGTGEWAEISYTPMLKVQRNVVHERHAAEIESLYSG